MLPEVIKMFFLSSVLVVFILAWLVSTDCSLFFHSVLVCSTFHCYIVSIPLHIICLVNFPAAGFFNYLYFTAGLLIIHLVRVASVKFGLHGW
jgi:hypothetical protein